MMRGAAGVLLGFLLGCSDRAAPPPAPAQPAAVVPPPAAPSAATPVAEAPRQEGPRLLSLGYTLTDTHRMHRFEWRRWQELHWQGVSDSMPALPAEPAHDSDGCGPGMLRVKGRFVLDTQGRSDTDEVTVLQNQTCTFWRTADRGENGLCDRFDAERWRAKVAALPRRALDYCIDRYEYPNAYGELPLVVVTFSEAETFCKKESKRLCSEDEWTFACEGEAALPYPYGFERDAEACNIGVLGPGPTKDMFSPRTTKDTARGIDLSWRGKRSGEAQRCKSPFGVMDLTGNVDEWTVNARNYGRKMIMKGGHWGPARQRCRPATRGHGPFYLRYDQGFRCCSDAPR